MKNIFYIYKNDLKSIITNWVTAVIIGGLIVLPSLYAWFNIKASWDPYSNTQGILIAVSNQDEGTNIRGQVVNIGNEIVSSLKKNKNLGWTFVNEEEALKGVKEGDYYASLTIPADFSKKIGTVLTDELSKPTIHYYVNEKTNAIAPKITTKGATGVVEEVSANFVKTANEMIFKIFNELGIELERELPSIRAIEEWIFKVEEHFPGFATAVNSALEDAQKAEEIVGIAQKNLPIVAEIAQTGQQLTERINQFLDKSEAHAKTIGPNIKQELSLIEEMAASSTQVIDLLEQSDLEPNVTVKSIDQTIAKLETSISIIDALLQLFNKINELAGSTVLEPEMNKLSQAKTNTSAQIQLLATIKTAIQNGEKPASDLIHTVKTRMDETTGIIKDIRNLYEAEGQSILENSFGHAQKTSAEVQQLLNEATSTIPTIEKMLDDAVKGLAIGKTEIAEIQKRLPELQAKVVEFANKIRDFKAREDIDEIINILKNDYEKESDFFANPVLLKENKLYPIPNYGSAMSPFFTTLSLWVGALLLISLIHVNIAKGERYKSYEIYVGRFFTFLTIALLQSFIVTMGDIFLLKAYVVNKGFFVLFGLLISTVFMLIVYTFVSVFGNVGKALAIILLVLQLAGSGGTFPIQVTPPFFQAINPFLPFTYAISLLRETVGGMLPNVVIKDLFMLGIYAICTLLFGLGLKKPVNRLTANIAKKAKEGDLIH
ncbi:YhgE/Pip domain-containing protein [Bacillus chungangensis]|uniref:Membrane protein n=1 Tax=Bacillus chungangensis TaxID=587633 RepID=A0ABT9WUI1_9BACI|nr:YhgE/Pip domain-containing protein [Bacillus chungangensis]MDQ0176779.1 putative membrane protein [Bacillus chungangensis]